jgi:hypothetical protein
MITGKCDFCGKELTKEDMHHFTDLQYKGEVYIGQTSVIGDMCRDCRNKLKGKYDELTNIKNQELKDFAESIKKEENK